MSEFVTHKLSYKDLRERAYTRFEDPYGIVGFMTEHLRETLLSCPYNDDGNKTAMYVVTKGSVAVGRALECSTRVKIGSEIVPAQASFSLFVEERFRPEGAGADLLVAAKLSKDYDLKIGSLFSEMVIPMLKKLRYTIFEIPQFARVLNTRPLIESLGFKGALLNTVAFFTDIPLCLVSAVGRMRCRRLCRRFIVRKEDIVPEWVCGIVGKDDAKYMEYHDRDWFQWNLDHNMNGFPGDKQSFFSVFGKDGEALGFFMTKERFERKAGRYRNILRGVIVEWGSADPDVLSEADLNILATETFSPDTFIVQTVSTDRKTVTELRRFGFVRHGTLHMDVLDKKKQYKDIGDMTKWRLRYGCGNTIIFGQV